VPADDAGAVFSALADPLRRRLVERLAELGGSTPTRLAAELPVTRQAVSKHLDALLAAGLVHRTRQGRETRFELAPGRFDDARAWLDAVGTAWDERLDRLRRHLQQE
jgi:DNA-binding transcriptional ArsR family regulator